MIPKGLGYTPEELGLPFPECPRIFVGCIKGHTIFDFGQGAAHTHKFEKDRFYNCICITDKKLLWNSDGSISLLAWHEYAHVIDPAGLWIAEAMLELGPKIQDAAHGESFVQTAISLGYPQAGGRTVYRW